MDNGTIIYGGGHDRVSRSIEPTLLADAAPDSSLLRQEIFGPLLPIMISQDIKSIMIDRLNSAKNHYRLEERDKPIIHLLIMGTYYTAQFCKASSIRTLGEKKNSYTLKRVR